MRRPPASRATSQPAELEDSVGENRNNKPEATNARVNSAAEANLGFQLAGKLESEVRFRSAVDPRVGRFGLVVAILAHGIFEFRWLGSCSAGRGARPPALLITQGCAHS